MANLYPSHESGSQQPHALCLLDQRALECACCKGELHIGVRSNVRFGVPTYIFVGGGGFQQQSFQQQGYQQGGYGGGYPQQGGYQQMGHHQGGYQQQGGYNQQQGGLGGWIQQEERKFGF